MNGYHLILLLQVICLVSGGILIARLFSLRDRTPIICIGNYMAINITYMVIAYYLLNSDGELPVAIYNLTLISSFLSNLLFISIPLYLKRLLNLKVRVIILLSLLAMVNTIILVLEAPIDTGFRYIVSINILDISWVILDIYIIIIILRKLKKFKRERVILLSIQFVALIHLIYYSVSYLTAQSLDNRVISIEDSALSLIGITIIFLILTTLLNIYYYKDELKFDSIDKYQLSPRELEVSNLLIRGLGNKEIGETLHISESTVKTHCTRIYKKVGVTNKFQLISKLSEKSVNT